MIVGTIIHGFANGVFGRDSYHCRVVEAEGTGWYVTRNEQGQHELLTKLDAEYIINVNDLSYCGGRCSFSKHSPLM